MNGTNKPMLLSHHGRKLLNVVPMLLVFSLGFVLGMTSNTKFPNVYLPFVPLLPSHTPPPPHLPTRSPPLPQPPPSPSPQNPQMALAGFLAPSSVMHNMTDEELFWRASMVPKVRRTPYHQVPKVSFLFLVRGDLPLRPLWEKFFAGNEGLYSIYVHVDPSYTSSPPKDSVFYGRMILSQKTMWGHVTLLEAERRLLANALLDRSNERFVVLSESCIPVYDFATVYALLTGSNTSFVDSYFNRGRYNDFFARRCNISLAQWRKGSQWFEMDRDLAVKVVSDDIYFPEFREYCADHEPCLMEEHYMATLPIQLGWTRNANRSLMYVDWRKGGFHPRRYGGKDVTEELIKEIRGGAGKNCTYNGRPGGICYVFARKFAPDTLDPLLALAPKVMGFGG